MLSHRYRTKWIISGYAMRINWKRSRCCIWQSVHKSAHRFRIIPILRMFCSGGALDFKIRTADGTWSHSRALPLVIQIYSGARSVIETRKIQAGQHYKIIYCYVNDCHRCMNSLLNLSNVWRNGQSVLPLTIDDYCLCYWYDIISRN